MADFTALAKLGRVEKEIEVTEGLKVKVHTLSLSEQQRALSRIPTSVENEISRLSFLQQSILSEATDEVNGEVISKKDAEQLYSDLQFTLVSKIFTEYSLITEEQDKVLEELKKK